MSSSPHAMCTLSTMMTAGSMADLPIPLPIRPLLGSAILSALRESCSATILMTFSLQLSKEIVRYNLVG